MYQLLTAIALTGIPDSVNVGKSKVVVPQTVLAQHKPVKTASGGQMVTVYVKPVAKAWDNYCIGFRQASVSDNEAHEFNDSDGWNKVLRKKGVEGWRLVQLIYQGDNIGAACFTRPVF